MAIKEVETEKIEEVEVVVGTEIKKAMVVSANLILVKIMEKVKVRHDPTMKGKIGALTRIEEGATVEGVMIEVTVEEVMIEETNSMAVLVNTEAIVTMIEARNAITTSRDSTRTKLTQNPITGNGTVMILHSS